MLKKKNIIGFDRKIELEWANYIAELVLRKLSESEIREKLARKLSVYGLGTSKGGALSKTITVLTRLWLNVPDSVVPLRNKALNLYKLCDENEKVILHLCLAMSNYPFFFDVLTQIGRLLKLQDNFSSEQITRRIIEKWGDTQRVKRSVDHVLQALKLWNVIAPLQKISIYGCNRTKASDKIQLFVAESLSIALGTSHLAQEIKHHPAIFFCEMNISVSKIEQISIS